MRRLDHPTGRVSSVALVVVLLCLISGIWFTGSRLVLAAAPTVTVGTGSGGVGTSISAITLTETGNNVQGVFSLTPTIANNPNSPQSITSASTANGAVTITVVTGSAGVVIQPPTTGALALTLKGVSGDTGVGISKIAPTEIEFDNPPPTNFVITSTGVETVQFFWF